MREHKMVEASHEPNRDHNGRKLFILCVEMLPLGTR